jgi:hypothetical protein
MKKSLLCAVALVCVGALNCRAAEPAAISGSDLSALGLSGMSVVSDAEGSKVRGMGFSLTSGVGFAMGLNPFAGFSTNNYNSGGALLSGGSNWSTGGTGTGFGLGVFNALTGGGFGTGQFGGGGSSSFGF